MTRYTADVAILGAGFGGSLAALVLDRIGLRPVLIDRGAHPRFAIGESSTPAADLVLGAIARRYNLPRLLPLTHYGTWQRAYPQLACGLKRGFSYFKHVPASNAGGVSFVPGEDHANELLVAASSDDERSDTHWFRADVDSFFAGEVQSAGILYLDRCEIESLQHGDGWRLAGRRAEAGEPVELSARFLIDATGEGGFLRRHLGIECDGAAMQTNSRTIYAHFAGLEPWQQTLERAGADTVDHPFCCDHAALHQILDEGWMWQLRFNNGVTSAGFVFDAGRSPLDRSLVIDEEWNALLRRYPSIARQFDAARIVNPTGGLRRSGRLQRRARRVAGADWAMLPNTAGFIDPLYSTGIAQTLCGIERLADILATMWDRTDLVDALKHYERTIHAELDLIDGIVAGSFAGFRNFPLLVSFSMLYFAAATTWERRRLAAQDDLRPLRAFLCADDPDFCRIVADLRRRLETVSRNTDCRATAAFERELAAAIAPYNTSGLCDPAVHNMYRYTALPTA